MRIIFLLLLLGGICLNIRSQPDIKEIENSLVKLNDTLFASKYEVSNSLYKDFISYSLLYNKTELNDIQIDSSNWRSLEFDNEPFAQYYHLHPAYFKYPVVNISYEGAILFCKWLTECYNNYPKRKFKKVIFRLPSKEEWELTTKDLNNKPDLENNSSILAIDSYKDSNGLFNILGNVSEMTSTKGFAKGGNWKNDKTNNNFNYKERSSPFVGFRFFVVIVE